jgi:hypothetical protein
LGVGTAKGTSERHRRGVEAGILRFWRDYDRPPAPDLEIAQLRADVDVLLIVVEDLVTYVNSKMAS